MTLPLVADMGRIYLIIICCSIALLTLAVGLAWRRVDGAYRTGEASLLQRILPR